MDSLKSLFSLELKMARSLFKKIYTGKPKVKKLPNALQHFIQQSGFINQDSIYEILAETMIIPDHLPQGYIHWEELKKGVFHAVKWTAACSDYVTQAKIRFPTFFNATWNFAQRNFCYFQGSTKNLIINP